MEVKRKFSVLDVVIIAAVLAVVLVAAITLNLVDMEAITALEGERTTAVFTVEVQNVDDRIKEELLLTEGQEISLDADGNNKAVVQSVDFNRAVTMTYDMVNGEYKEQYRYKNWDVYVTLEAEATETPEALKVGSQAIRVGSRVSVHNGLIGPSGYIIQLHTEEGGAAA